MSQKSELDLTEAPDSPEDEREELEEDFDKIKADFEAKYGEALDRAEADIQNLIQRTEVLTFQSQGLFRAQSRVTRDPLEDARSNEGNESIQQLEDQAQNILDRNGASNGSGNDGEGGNKNASHNTKRWILGLIGIIAVAGLGIIFEELYRKSTKKGDADVPLPDDVKKNIQDLVEKWASADDKTFWGDLANYVQNNSFTLADIVYFMQYTQQFFPLTEPFLWDNFQDKTHIVNQIEKVYSDNNKSVVVAINLLPKLTYKNSPLPRNIQASCAQLAFADLAGSSQVTMTLKVS